MERNARPALALLLVVVMSLGLSACGDPQDGMIDDDTWRVIARPIRTGLSVEAGSIVRIESEGRIDLGGAVAGFGAPKLTADGDSGQTPLDYPAPLLKKNSLIVRIGLYWYQGGTDTQFTPTSAGEIMLQPNDAVLEDNSRGWEVTVTVLEPEDGAPIRYGPMTLLTERTLDVEVEAGQEVHVVSSGYIDFGGAVVGLGAPILDANGDDAPTPRGYPAPGLRRNSLVIKVGSIWYQGGTDTRFVPSESGQVTLTPNDEAPGDNSRQWTVILEVTGRSTPDTPTTYGPFGVVNSEVFTGIRLNGGETLRLQSSGLIDFGGAVFGIGAPVLTADGDDAPTTKDYPEPDFRKNSLVARVGGSPYQGGTNAPPFRVDSSGELTLLPNDGTLGDNSRGWSVIVTVE